MSALIKQGAAKVTRSLSLGIASQPSPIAASDPRDTEIAELNLQIARLTEKLAGAERAASEMREQGRAAGLAEADDRAEERLAELRDALAEAAKRFDVQLALLDDLAPQLARAALEKLFAPAENWAGMAQAMIARQLQLLGGAAKISLRVSAEDFGTDQIEAIGGTQCRIEIDPALRSGSARITCRLDQIDLDVRQQWTELTALLDAMAERAA